MKIGIISDIHDNIWKLDEAFKKLAQAEVLICCGDLCSPFVVDRLGKGFAGPIHVVFGNNDADRFRMLLRAAHYPHLKLHGEYVELELDGKSFAINHFDNIGRALAQTGVHDVVCYGHNHEFEVVPQGRTLQINPGEIMGGIGKAQVSTFVIYDSLRHQADRVDV